MKVRLKRGWSNTYPDLTVGNVYRVLGIEADDLRILSDTGEPVLFHAQAFELLDSKQPANWIAERRDGELYAYPPELREPRSFFEKFFDYDMRVRQRFHGYVHSLCHEETASMPDPPNSYLRAEWNHEHPSDPVTLYSELDDERWEVRKVEVFRDGRITHAWGKGCTGTTRLGELAVPLLTDIAKDRQFSVTEINRAEFEAVWDQALDSEDV